jgi:tetraacyldisaccharide 4'-kinase
MTPALSTLYTIGKPFSPLYSAIMKLRASFYSHKWFTSHRLSIPVISIGNLTMGGTGKTPMVLYITKMLKTHGFSPAIISRGYGGRFKEKVNIVSDKKTLYLNAEDGGDEPRLLAESLPTVPVLTGTKRIHPCLFAIENMDIDVILLDDGFQHLAIQRDLDLVLFNSANLIDDMHVFPGGYLREPFSALSRASAYIITNATQKTPQLFDSLSQSFPKSLESKPCFYLSYVPSHLTCCDSDTIVEMNDLPSSLFAFCGIANPSRFKQTLTDHKVPFHEFLPFSDHQRYSAKLISSIEKRAIKSGCKALITTEKDRVKLEALPRKLPLYTISMKIPANDQFNNFIIERLRHWSE